jgi:hypothetical protein
MLSEYFVCARINTNDQADEARGFDLLWTPTLVVLDHHGHRLRQVVGYLPPAQFLAELSLVRGLSALRSGRAAAAEDLLQQVVIDFPGSDAAPEALYWRGVAAYRRSRDKEELWGVWQELVVTFPWSVWAMKTTLMPEPKSAAS